jgi:hypothetical protein
MKSHRLALAGLLLVACKSDQKQPPAEASKPVAESEAPPAAAQAGAGSRAEAIANAPTPLAPGMTRLEKLNLQIALPSPTSRVHEMGEDAYTIVTGSLWMQVEPGTDVTPKTLDDAKRFVSAYSPIGLKGEELPGGWLVTFKTEVNGTPAAPWFLMKRSVGDAVYKCSASGGTPAENAASIEACKSLKR